MSTPVLIACGIACIVVFFLACAFLKPVKGLFKLILNSALGWAGLYIFNTLFAFANLSIGINLASASIVGILGLPGLILMILVKLIYKL